MLSEEVAPLFVVTVAVFAVALLVYTEYIQPTVTSVYKKICNVCLGPGETVGKVIETLIVDCLAFPFMLIKAIWKSSPKTQIIASILILVAGSITIAYKDLPFPGKYGFVNTRDGAVGINHWNGKIWLVNTQPDSESINEQYNTQ